VIHHPNSARGNDFYETPEEATRSLLDVEPLATKKPIRAHRFPRDRDEHYVEPEWCSIRLFQEEGFDRTHIMLDACCGFGRISEAARAAGYKVESSDIVDRGYAGQTRVQDFLERKQSIAQLVCNPPFLIAPEFVEHALALGARKIAIIFPTRRLNAAHRWTHTMPLRRIWLMTPRPSIPPGFVITRGEKPGGGKVDFAC
jgi:hypothetical protein